MKVSRSIILSELKQVVLLVTLGGIIGGYFSCRSCFDEFGQRTMAIVILNGCYWLFFWKGNEYISEYIDKKVSWLAAPARRFWIGLLVMAVYTLSAATVINYAFYVFYLGNDFSVIKTDGLIVSIVVPVFVTFFIMTFLFGREFFTSWRQAAINLEKLKSEQLASQYETLKSQVNPHFLFNSLNVLTSLVHQDPDTAVRFIKKLSEVYRFVLDSRKQEVVDLRTEMTFVNDYMYLQKIRFGDNILCKTDIPDGLLNKVVPPLSIQMLVENAIKHNEVSADYPLHIRIFADNETITVSNTRRLRRNTDPSSGFGLGNIRDRYEFLSGKKVLITESDSIFEVKLPLLNIEQDQ